MKIKILQFQIDFLLISIHYLQVNIIKHLKILTLLDFGFTEGLKDNNKIKDTGNNDHLFTKLVKNFDNVNGVEKNLTITTQKVSNDKYLKLYKLKSNLVDYKSDTLKNSIDFSYEAEDLFLGFNASMYETLKDDYNDKYEYILPEIILENIARNKRWKCRSNLKL